MPLRYGVDVVGVLVISKLGLDQFDADDLRLLEVLAGHASVAFVNARLYEAERREAKGAKALLELSRELSSGTQLDEVVERIARGGARILGVQRTSVGCRKTRAPDRDIVCRGAWSAPGVTGSAKVGDRLPAHVASTFARSPDPFVITFAEYEDLIADSFPGVLADAYAIVPIGLDAGRGAITFALDGADSLDDRQLELLSAIAGQAKLALINAFSFETLERTFLSTVEALANALEAKDEYTSTHAQWIRDMSVTVGEELGLDTATLKRIELGALFHDIGKIGIPSAILSKPGPLTRRGAGDHRDPPRARRADPRADRPARARAADRPRLPRALRRDGLSRRARGRGDTSRGSHHLRLRRVPRHDDDASLPGRAPDRGGAQPAPQGGRHRSSIPPSSISAFAILQAP